MPNRRPVILRRGEAGSKDRTSESAVHAVNEFSVLYAPVVFPPTAEHLMDLRKVPHKSGRSRQNDIACVRFDAECRMAAISAREI